MRYPITFDSDKTGWVVLFPDIPEAMAAGDARDEALSSAQDVLVTALTCYFKDRREIPFPSAQGETFVQIPASVAAKILLLNAVVQQDISNADLARLTGTRAEYALAEKRGTTG